MMKMNFKVMMILFFVIVLSSFGYAEISQQFNKIFLNPFYRVSMNNNQNYSYTIDVKTSDGISNVKSAIINFDVYLTPTVTFSLWINDISCNNPTYTVSTTYASASQGRITFDCSNIIKESGIYNVVLKPSGANTGAITGWLDLTYMNNPKGNIKLHGTEYIGGDLGKMFLQFLDSNFQPVSNSECFLSLWYPNDTILLNNSLMSKLDNASDGIYYKNFNVPYISGVYPASAKCYKPLTFNNIVLYNYTFDGFESNSWTGGIGWSECPQFNISCTNGWDVEDTVPLATIVSTATANPCYSGNYCAKYTGSYGFIERGTVFPDGTYAINVSFAFRFKGFQTNEHGEFWIFDGNWHLIFQFGQSSTYGSYTNNVWYKKDLILPSNIYELNTVLFGFYVAQMPSTSDEIWIDDVMIDVISPNVTISNITDYQILRGSGEVHVSNLYQDLNSSLSFLNNLTPQRIWNYTERSLTYYDDVVNYSKIWNNTERTLTYYPQVDVNLTNESLNIISNNFNSSLSSTNQGIFNISGEMKMIAYMILFVVALIIGIFSQRTDLDFLSILMFLALIVGFAGMGYMVLVYVAIGCLVLIGIKIYNTPSSS